MEQQTFFRKQLSPLNTELSVKLVAKQPVSKVLCIDASAYVVSYECVSGEALVNGRCNYRLVVMDTDGNISGLNYNADFAERVLDESISKEAKLSFCCSCTECKSKIEGNIIDIDTSVQCLPCIFARQPLQLAQEQEGVIVQKSTVGVCTYAQNVDVPISIVEQIITKHPINAVISAKSCVFSKDCQYANGVLAIEGECSVELLYTGGEDNTVYGEVIAYPFKEEIEIALVGDKTMVCCGKVKNTKVRLDVVEQQDNTTLSVETVAEFSLSNYSVENIEVIADAYSVTNQIALTKQAVLTTLPVCNREYEYTISHYHEFDTDVGDVVACLCAQATNTRVMQQNGQLAVDGILNLELLCRGEKLDSVHIEVPYTQLFQDDCITEQVQLNSNSCITALNIRQDRRGVDINGQVVITTCVFATVEQSVTASIEMGDSVKNNQWTFEVVNATIGDDLWTVAKNLNMREQDIATLNPGLSFPLDRDEQIVVYHRL
ncbi:MAG: hypothetical protein PHW00_00785 [Clostridia bacterium]|nr:hypothetical protein [Clostridia bacterium]